MALVGAIILARREYVPDYEPADEQKVLTLRERPRELVAAGSDSQEN